MLRDIKFLQAVSGNNTCVTDNLVINRVSFFFCGTDSIKGGLPILQVFGRLLSKHCNTYGLHGFCYLKPNVHLGRCYTSPPLVINYRRN